MLLEECLNAQKNDEKLRALVAEYAPVLPPGKSMDELVEIFQYIVKRTKQEFGQNDKNGEQSFTHVLPVLIKVLARLWFVEISDELHGHLDKLDKVLGDFAAGQAAGNLYDQQLF